MDEKEKDCAITLIRKSIQLNDVNAGLRGSAIALLMLVKTVAKQEHDNLGVDYEELCNKLLDTALQDAKKKTEGYLGIVETLSLN